MDNNDEKLEINRKSLFHDWLGEPLTFKQWVKYRVERRAEKRRYWHTMKPMYKAIEKAAKDFRAWDEGYMFDILEAIINCWIQYYTHGDNVICADEEKPMPRAQIAMRMKEKLDAMNEAALFVRTGNTPDKWHDKTKEFFDFMAEYIHYMWD